MATRMRRNRTNLPNVYYEGNLEMRSFRDKASVKRWTVLSGNTLFYFNTSQDADYLEKLDLVDYKSVTDDASQDQNLTAARFILRLRDKTIKFTAPSMEARELWKGFIHGVVQLAVPPHLTLLPGQLLDLHKAVQEEEQRRSVLPGPQLREEVQSREQSHSTYQGGLPECYLRVSRWEAELLLEREPDRGNLLLRPGGHGNTFTMTTREILDRPVFKHYSVTEKPDGSFVMDLQNPISCASLEEMVSMLVDQTRGALTPFVTQEIYENNISFVAGNKESGEKSNYVVPPVRDTPVPPPKPVPVRRLSSGPVEPSPTQEEEEEEEEEEEGDGELYLSGPENEREPSPGAPVPCPRVKSTGGSDSVGVWRPAKQGDVVTRPITAPPPVPNAQTIVTASEYKNVRAVTAVPASRVGRALLPPPVNKIPPQRSFELKQNGDAATPTTAPPTAAPPTAAPPIAAPPTVAPPTAAPPTAPVPPHRPPGAFSLTRSQSDASHGVTEELRQKLAKARIRQNLD